MDDNDNDGDDDDDDVTYRDLYAVQGNYVIGLSSFSSTLKKIVVCRSCEDCSLELLDCGERASCASSLMFRYNSCHYSRSFCSVSGTLGRTSFPVGTSKIEKRNDIVYNCILGRRLVGIGFNKLSSITLH